ncbi:hypothetical protein FHS15_000335 [Paenibacillus castaneae]|uniref:hypothetical protein n=1 Tax=Paenibacillus castaneae TaxID=474957 RepID=UPI000C9B4BDF|nr:hypothetical protein [Paenibacillus castaneae]NIK75237.1 hypothetical protein [Paenibacillus castaneae]
MKTIARSSIILIAALLTLLIISPTKSNAWSCFESTEPKQLLERNDSVFIGKVIDISYENVGSINKKSRATFEIESSWKGNNANQVTVVTSVGSQFQQGDEYLVYAYQTTENNYLYKYEAGELATDSLCNGTKEISLAAYDIEQLDKAGQSNKTILFILFPILLLSLAIVMSLLIVKRRRKRN